MATNRRQIVAAALLLLPAFGCGEKKGPDVTFTFSGASVSGNTAIADTYFLLQNQADPTLGYVLPRNCDYSAPPAGCGYPRGSGEITMGGLPLGSTYAVLVRFRNASGAVLFSGKTTFVNGEASQTVTIPLSTGDSNL
jgi:hypothetical protein